MTSREALKRFHSGDDRLGDLITDGAPAELPTPDTDEPMVSRSVRLPLDTYERIREAADARGLGVTTLMRQWIEAGLADLDDTATVTLADVRRALAALAQQRPTAA
jgi:predicted DNA-binding protein